MIRFDEVMGAHIPVFASTGTALFPASARLRMRQGCFASEEEAREWAERVYPMLRDVAARHVKPRDTRPVCTVCEGRMVRSIYGARWECPRCPGVEIDHE